MAPVRWDSSSSNVVMRKPLTTKNTSRIEDHDSNWRGAACTAITISTPMPRMPSKAVIWPIFGAIVT